jgi:hypothetical protein
MEVNTPDSDSFPAVGGVPEHEGHMSRKGHTGGQSGGSCPPWAPGSPTPSVHILYHSLYQDCCIRGSPGCDLCTVVQCDTQTGNNCSSFLPVRGALLRPESSQLLCPPAQGDPDPSLHAGVSESTGPALVDTNDEPPIVDKSPGTRSLQELVCLT